MIEYMCPHCGTLLKIPPQYAGQKGKCNHCNNVITVPQAAAPGARAGASASSEPARSIEEFASRASQSSASFTTRMSEVGSLVTALKDALTKTYPNLQSGEALSHATGGLSLRCPNCGPLSDQVLPYLLLAGTGMLKGAIFGGPNVAALAKARCPGCSGETVVATFSPQKIKDQLEASKAAMAAAKGVPELAAVCPGIPFVDSLNVSPDQNLLCCVAPGNAVVACETGANCPKWSLPIPSSETCLCRFVGPERLLVVSEKEKDQSLIQLVNTNDGAVIDQAVGPKAYYSSGDANPRTGLFVGQKSYDALLIVQTAGDKIAVSTYECGQIYSPGPKIGPDGQCYVIIHYALYRIDGNAKRSIMEGNNCICFEGPANVYCGSGHADRSGESALFIADLKTGATSKIPWGREPIDEIALAGNGRLLLANDISEVHMGRYPNAVVALVSLAGGKKEWSLTIGDLKPRCKVILASAPEENWALIQTGAMLKLIALQNGATIRVLPKQPQEILSANWLPSKKLLYITRNPGSKKPGSLECYTV